MYFHTPTKCRPKHLCGSFALTLEGFSICVNAVHRTDCEICFCRNCDCGSVCGGCLGRGRRIASRCEENVALSISSALELRELQSSGLHIKDLNTTPFMFSIRKWHHTLSVSLSELYLDLTSTDPLSVQIMQGIFCVSHILEPAAAVKASLFF